MKRVLCLWLPNWPVQRRKIAGGDKRRAVVVHGTLGRGKERVIACCRYARRRGVTPGMRLANAESLWPTGANVSFDLHDPQADRQGLRDLAALAQQFSPFVAIDDADPADCLLLDATGCGFGFGGEQLFAEKLLEAVHRRGCWATAAIADTVRAAWAVARFSLVKRVAGELSSRIAIVEADGQKEALLPLPIEALRLPARMIEVLHELNVIRVDQLLALPRNQLPARFGNELLTIVDRAFGVLPEGINAEPNIEPLELTWVFEPPVGDTFAMLAAIEDMLERLFKKLRGQDAGIQRLLWWAKPERSERVCFPVELVRPTVSQRDLLALIRLQLERLRVTEEIVEIAMRAQTAPLVFEQFDLFGTRADGRDDVANLLERLTSRLGDRAVLRPMLNEDAQPEYACRYEPWLGSSRKIAEMPIRPEALTRPPILKRKPAPLAVLSVQPGGGPRRIRWENRDLDVARTWGPERIEAGWWRGDDIRRDYYVAETAGGERLWLFRNLASGEWFLHGVYG